MIKKLKLTVLLILPLILLIIGFSFDRTKYGTDPESAYLVNGLNIAMCKSAGLFEHPGTTVQTVNAGIICITHFLRFGHNDLQTDVLTNSEFYIETLRKSYIVLNSILLMLLGIVTFSLLNNLWLSLILQLAPFLSTTLIEELSTKIAPEQLLFASCLLLIMLIVKYYSSDSPDNKKFAIVSGLLGGFGLATKFTFLTMLVIPVIILKGKLNRIIYLITIIPSFILFTLPVAPAYKQMLKWYLALGTHNGIYGQGNKGVIDPAQYISSFVKIMSNNKTMAFALIISGALLSILLLRSLLNKKTGRSEETVYVIALFAALSGSILMVAKHYYSNHYLFPALSMTGLVFVFIYLWFYGSVKEKTKKTVAFYAPAMFLIFVILALLNIPYLSLAYEGYRQSNQSTDETMARIRRDYKDYVKTYYYPTSFNEYSSLRWGNVYSRRIHTDKLKQLFPRGLFYDVRENSFQLWETTISPDEIVKKFGDKILLIGGPLTLEDLKRVEDGGLKLRKLFEGRIQVVYEINTAQSALFQHDSLHGTQIWKLQSNFDTLSADKKWIMANGLQFCKSTGLSAEKTRSGKFSISLPVADTYAMEYVLRNCNPGEMFQASIWRFGGDQEASIVVSSQKADQLYVKSMGTVETDAKGWSKLTVNFKVPAGIDDNKIKVYLWNHGDLPAWFDDFEISEYK